MIEISLIDKARVILNLLVVEFDLDSNMSYLRLMIASGVTKIT